MKIAILGGGITGLTCAEVLSRGGANEITVYESEPFCGGLASGFKKGAWEWSLERAYHHVFASDRDILDYSKEIGFDGFYFISPKTTSMYLVDSKHKTIAIDTPTDLLLFPLLNLFERIRAGFVLAFLKISPHLWLFERSSTEGLMSGLMGKKSYATLFGEPMKKKFGKYAGNILSGFIWARVNKRTKKLGYVKGGFQEFVNHIQNICERRGVRLVLGKPVLGVERMDRRFVIALPGNQKEEHDYIVSTLPSPVAARSLAGVLSKDEIEKLTKLKHLASMNLILETKEKYFENEYWVSNCVEQIPALVFVQHTNFVSSKHYDGNNLLYIGNYLSESDALWSKTKDELVDMYTKYLESITGKRPEVCESFLFKARFSQPIFDSDFVSLVPKLETSDSSVFFANLDMTYPYDRGTNYAVKLGIQVATKITHSIEKTKKTPAHGA